MAGSELCTEVRVSFAGTIIQVTQLRPGQSFTLGEAPTADLTYATPDRHLHRLVMATADGAVLARPGTGALVALGADERTCIELGALTIEVGCEAQPELEFGHRPVDRGWWLSFSSSALLVVTFLFLTGRIAETQLPPLEAEVAPYLAYIVRDEPRPEESRRVQAAPAPPRAAVQPSSEPRRAPKKSVRPAQLDDLTAVDPDLRTGRVRQRKNAPALRRDEDPVEAAREAGVLGVMPEAEEAFEASQVLVAANFDPNVDDGALWASMTGGSIDDAPVAGLGLVGSGRGGGVASEAIRSGAPLRPRPEASEQPQIRVVSTRVEGGIDAKFAQRVANSRRNAWAKCLHGEKARSFELDYSVLEDGRVVRAKVSGAQLSSKSKRCIAAATETRKAAATKAGRPGKVAQRVELTGG